MELDPSPTIRYKKVFHYNIKVLNLSDRDLQLIKTSPIIKSKLKELLSELKKFRVQSILVLEYKKRNAHKIFYSITKLIASDSDIDEVFKSMHLSIMTKIKNSASKDWVVEAIVKDTSKIFFVSIDGNNALMHGGNK